MIILKDFQKIKNFKYKPLKIPKVPKIYKLKEEKKKRQPNYIDIVA